jgi:transcriptional regulator with XRE-family HTH domain
MKENIDSNLIINKRKSKVWTQSHLAEVSGLSLRTIQRIEKTGKASFESIKSLASVYETIAEELIMETNLKEETPNKKDKTKGKNLAVFGLVLSYSILLALSYSLIKLSILYIEISSTGTNDPRNMANGISNALTPSMISELISFIGVIIYGLSKVFYSYHNKKYNKLIILPIVLIIVIAPVKGIILISFFIIIKYTEKLTAIQN